MKSTYSARWSRQSQESDDRQGKQHDRQRRRQEEGHRGPHRPDQSSALRLTTAIPLPRGWQSFAVVKMRGRFLWIDPAIMPANPCGPGLGGCEGCRPTRPISTTSRPALSFNSPNGVSFRRTRQTTWEPRPEVQLRPRPRQNQAQAAIPSPAARTLTPSIWKCLSCNLRHMLRAVCRTGVASAVELRATVPEPRARERHEGFLERRDSALRCSEKSDGDDTDCQQHRSGVDAEYSKSDRH
jgi:hypothetical protein